MKKANRQALKKQEGNFNEPKVSLMKWCKSYGNLDRFNWIRGLILSELEQDGELGNYIYFGADFIDLYLSGDGVLIFSDTLGGFFGADEVKIMWKYLRSKSKEEKLFYDLEQVAKGATDEELQEYFRVWEAAKQNNINEPETVKRVLNLLQNEKKSRAKEALPLFMRLRLAKEQQR